MKAQILKDEGAGDWFVHSWYQDGEHRLAFARGENPFRCTAENRKKSARCTVTITPGFEACRFHGGPFIRGSNPVAARLDAGLLEAMEARNRANPAGVVEAIEEAVEALGIDVPLASLWPEYSETQQEELNHERA